MDESATSGLRDRVPPYAVDVAIALGVFAVALVTRAEAEGAAGFTREFDAFNYVLLALMSLPLVMRRRYPAAVLAVTLSAWMVARAFDYPNTLGSAGMIVAMHSIGAELSRRRSSTIGWSVVGGVAAFTLIGALRYESVAYTDVIFTGVVMAVPLLLGKEVHARRLRFEEMRIRAERAEAEREARARQAVAEERTRIARELHDVVAHQVAVMTLQAEGARRRVGDTDPRLGEALDTIRAAGHDGLAEMRRMVGLLRTDAGEAVEPDLAPQPGLGELDRLAEQMREAGLDLTVTTEGDHRDLPSGIDLNAYRIIQESLTNTLKHGGPGVRAGVRVRFGEDAVTVEIADDGRGAAAAAGNDGGHGIVGMRERVALVQGTLTAGPAPGGGYRVHAVLPLEQR